MKVAIDISEHHSARVRWLDISVNLFSCVPLEAFVASYEAETFKRSCLSSSVGPTLAAPLCGPVVSFGPAMSKFPLSLLRIRAFSGSLPFS